jgi:hypothetical protein
MKISAILFISIFLTLSLSAQVRNISERQHFKQSDWEVSTSAALGVRSISFESVENYYSNAENEGYFEISVTTAYYFIDGLAFEPELNFNFFDEVTLSLIANLSYTINIPRKSIYPYFKLGYGVSGFEAYYYYYESSEGLFESLDARVFNAAAGLKVIQSSSFALRLELNYKNFSLSKDMIGPYLEPHELKTSASVLSIKIGGSFLL